MEVLLDDMEEIMVEEQGLLLLIMKGIEITEHLLLWIIIQDLPFGVLQMHWDIMQRGMWDNITDPEHLNDFKTIITID